MKKSNQKQNEVDFLVIGSGLAGLMTALKLENAGKVLIVTKGRIQDGATGYAQGGVACVSHGDDSFGNHAEDTIKAGAGLCDEKIVDLVVSEGPARVQELISMGVQFNLRKKSGDVPETFDLGLEGGHSFRRILHVADRTGEAIHRILINRIRNSKNIKVLEGHFSVNLITKSDGPNGGNLGCLGAYILNIRTGQITAYTAKATILATGGAGMTYLFTSNPNVATGDGMAMAFRAGVALSNLEFVQFHPTCLYYPAAKSFLITEALRGEGAILKLKSGEKFMRRYHQNRELAPRDIVARAIDTELKKTGDDCVFLDIHHRDSEFLKKRFPGIYQKCLEYGIDITKHPIPVVPAAHYFCGGVKVDEWGRTNLERLFAVGEVACTGLHGANRLASNSLLECLVFAHRAAEMARRISKKLRSIKIPVWNVGSARNPDEQVVIKQNWGEVRRAMWNYVGIQRSDKILLRALRRLELLNQEIHEYYWDFKIDARLLQLRNISLVGELVVRSALARHESRGLHNNRNYPDRDDKKWRKASVIRKNPIPNRPPIVTFEKLD